MPTVEFIYRCNDDGNSVVADSSGNNRHGVLFGDDAYLPENTSDAHTTGIYMYGLPDSYFALDQHRFIHTGDQARWLGAPVAGDYLTRWLSALQGSFALSFWVKFADGQPDQVRNILSYLLYYPYTNGLLYDHLLVRLSTAGSLIFRFGTSATVQAFAATASPVFNNGQTGWYNVYLSADQTVEGPGGLSIYVNGIKKALSASPYDGNTAGLLAAWQSWGEGGIWDSIHGAWGNPPLSQGSAYSALRGGWNVRAIAPSIGNQMLVRVGALPETGFGAESNWLESTAMDINEFVVWSLSEAEAADDQADKHAYWARWWYNGGEGRQWSDADDLPDPDAAPDPISPGDRPDFQWNTWTTEPDFRRPRYVF